MPCGEDRHLHPHVGDEEELEKGDPSFLYLGCFFREIIRACFNKTTGWQAVWEWLLSTDNFYRCFAHIVIKHVKWLGCIQQKLICLMHLQMPHILGTSDPLCYQLFVTVMNTWEKQHRGGKIYFGSPFQRFYSMVGWFHYVGPEMTENIMVKGMEEKSFSAHDSQETGWGGGEGTPVTRNTLPGEVSNDILYHLPVVCLFGYQWINPLRKSELLPRSHHFPKALTSEHCCTGDQAFKTLGEISCLKHTTPKYKLVPFS